MKSGLETLLENSSSPIDEIYKVRVFNILKYIQQKAQQKFDALQKCNLPTQYKKEFMSEGGNGIFFVLGYNAKNMKKYVEPLHTQAIFECSPMHIYDLNSEQRLLQLCKTKHGDGAYLATIDGYITHNAMHISVQSDLKEGESYSQFFGELIATKHRAAKLASKYMKDALIYTLSSDTNRIRVFENGRIPYSQLEKEIQPLIKGAAA